MNSSAMASYPTSAQLRTHIELVETVERLECWREDQARRILLYGSFVGSIIEHHFSLDRTMPHARAHIRTLEEKGVSIANGTVFLADTLSGPKGRFTRTWHAPAGGLWGSMIYISTLLPRYRMLAPLAVGIACCEAMRAYGAANAVIRWINDVLIDGLKAGGFLAENFTGHNSGEEYCLLGFGINVNNREFPSALDHIATSLALKTGKPVDLQGFTTCFLAKLSWNLGLLYWWEAEELHRFSAAPDELEHPLISRWKDLSDALGRRVVFGFDVQTNPQYEAIVQSITGDGGLRLRLDDGTEVVEHSGEIRYLD